MMESVPRINRKIIQISSTSVVDSSDFETYVVYALCNDGSVWEIADCTGNGHITWNRLPDIPQA